MLSDVVLLCGHKRGVLFLQHKSVYTNVSLIDLCLVLSWAMFTAKYARALMHSPGASESESSTRRGRGSRPGRSATTATRYIIAQGSYSAKKKLMNLLQRLQLDIVGGIGNAVMPARSSILI